MRENVDVRSATVITDQFKGYVNLKTFVNHKSVNHSANWAVGNVHTNTIEGFWALVKRGIMGQYHKVSVKYLPKYSDEFSYRFNNRATDADKFFENTLKRCVTI